MLHRWDRTGPGRRPPWEILEGYRDRDAGEVEVLGLDPQRGGRDLRERIGIVLQSPGHFRELTVREVVELFGGYYPHPRAAGEVIGLVGLDEKAGARVKTISGGQQRRLGRPSGWSATSTCSSWTSRPPGSTRRPGGAPGS